MKKKQRTKPAYPVSQTLRRIFREHAEFKRPITVLIILNFVGILFSTVGPLLIGKIVDAAVSGEVWNNVLVLLGLYAVTSFAAVQLAYVRYNHQVKHLDWQQSSVLIQKTFAHLARLTMGQLKHQHSVVTQSKVNNGQVAVRNLFDGIMYQALPTLITALISCLMMTAVYPVLGIVTMALCVVMVFMTVDAARRIYKSLKRAKKYEHEVVHKRGGDLMRNLPAIMLANAEEQSLHHICDSRRVAARNYRGTHLPLGKMQRRMWSLNLGGRVVVTGLAAWFVYEGSYQVGAIAASAAWILQSLGRLQDLHETFRNMLQSWIDAELYFEIRDVTPDFEAPEHAVRLECIEGRVVLENVHFTYPGAGQPALEGVSCIIEAGETVGIVGPSGAGKSTILSMLQGAYQPAFGSVTIDGIDMRNLDMDAYRQQVGFVEQETTMFDWSLRENLLFGVPKEHRAWLDDNPDEIIRVLLEVGLEHLLPRLHNRMGETGRGLSGGEKQRIAIARIVLKRPEMIIVDEGTSSVDPSTERRVHAALQAVSPGSTRIFVAHRLSTVRDAGKIIVMNQGRIEAVGTHEELLGSCSLYEELVHNQLLRM